MAAYPKYDKLPTVQIILYTRYTLSEYFRKVKRAIEEKGDILDILDLPFDLSDRCPLCGGKDCAEFIGYYYRGVVDEKGTYSKSFPIVRFKCNRKGGPPVVDHKTFSLLPYQLVPYRKYSIDFIFKTLVMRYKEQRTIEYVFNHLADVHRGDQYIDLSTKTFYAFKELVMDSINRLLVSGYYKEAEEGLQNPCHDEQIRSFIEFSTGFYSNKTNPSIRGPCALSYDYYRTGGYYVNNSHFLFGTPSQFR